MSDSFSVDSLSGTSDDKELQEFLMIEKQKATINAQIHEFTDQCWDKCVDKLGSKMDYKTESCLTNCVERFIDVSQLITGRFAKMLQSSVNGLQ
ncbi:mitochondrial import inner membrane translocase subunit Tim8-like [Nilaparvata lugens]|uniref:mitochondrial import inner membrane translocase subunit Tim8 n=1 Tax=Nilaparvata lugens TaxID=108931 RepID=UPI000B99A690|nr:mitochondrial import inner membrane translocase subunit Tim8 [Nilaparvata lugens]XP_039295330.1 mitochondrial import inner membrane translocase subunit Tim8-like [Nilaparvata lugens]